eukprot:TRINITY_DN3627_c0_g1_i1.p1 TRINITY_DN3627_c0_g1~~TRINITY_DN3627_c0_g1_i1.p1  ORF type:complete len:732 (+),score=161.29 TRINITY_DN3627_c0_g1_i1:33-2198(+)
MNIALQKISDLADIVNDKKRDAENTSKCMKIFQVLHDPKQHIQSVPHRRFVREGYLHRIHSLDSPGVNHFFILFSDCFLEVIKEVEKDRPERFELNLVEVFEINSEIAIAELPPTPSSESYMSNVFTISSRGGTWLLGAPSETDKKLWLTDFNEAINKMKDKVTTLQTAQGLGDFHWQKHTENKRFSSAMGLRPGRLSHHVMEVMHKTIFIFGGTDGSQTSKGICSLDLDKFQWTHYSENGDCPPPLSMSGAKIVETTVNGMTAKYLIITGGSDGEEDIDQTYAFNTEAHVWHCLTHRIANKELFTSRAGHSVGNVANVLYIFGGKRESKETKKKKDKAKDKDKEKAFKIGKKAKLLNELIVLRCDTALAWEKPQVKGNGPSPRAFHSSSVFGKRIIIFGGIGEKKKYFNDVFVFDTDSMGWQQPEVTGEVPPPRCGHTANIIGKKMIVWGGVTPTGAVNEVYVLDLVNWSWINVQRIDGPLITARAFHKSVTSQSLLLFYGGLIRDESVEEMFALETGIKTPQANLPILPPMKQHTNGQFKSSSLTSIGSSDYITSFPLPAIKPIVPDPNKVISQLPLPIPKKERVKEEGHGSHSKISSPTTRPTSPSRTNKDSQKATTSTTTKSAGGTVSNTVGEVKGSQEKDTPRKSGEKGEKVSRLATRQTSSPKLISYTAPASSKSVNVVERTSNDDVITQDKSVVKPAPLERNRSFANSPKIIKL